MRVLLRMGGVAALLAAVVVGPTQAQAAPEPQPTWYVSKSGVRYYCYKQNPSYCYLESGLKYQPRPGEPPEFFTPMPATVPGPRQAPAARPPAAPPPPGGAYFTPLPAPAPRPAPATPAVRAAAPAGPTLPPLVGRNGVPVPSTSQLGLIGWSRDRIPAAPGSFLYDYRLAEAWLLLVNWGEGMVGEIQFAANSVSWANMALAKINPSVSQSDIDHLRWIKREAEYKIWLRKAYIAKEPYIYTGPRDPGPPCEVDNYGNVKYC